MFKLGVHIVGFLDSVFLLGQINTKQKNKILK